MGIDQAVRLIVRSPPVVGFVELMTSVQLMLSQSRHRALKQGTYFNRLQSLSGFPFVIPHI